jgi:hypothetical protein
MPDRPADFKNKKTASGSTSFAGFFAAEAPGDWQSGPSCALRPRGAHIGFRREVLPPSGIFSSSRGKTVFASGKAFSCVFFMGLL